MMQKIILATTSPHRKEAFRYLGIPFTCEPGDVDEISADRPEEPEALVLFLAKKKAEAVARNHTEGIVIGFDSVGWFNGIMEKPKSREEAFERLKKLSGNNYCFHTGIHMINCITGKTLSRVVETVVYMRRITDDEISRYLDQDPGFVSWAQGYDPFEHYSMSFTAAIEGSYYNLCGLPLETIIPMLFQLGFKVE